MAADYRMATFTWTAATFHRCGRKPSLLTLLINVVRTEPQSRTWAPRASWRRWNRFTVSQFEGQKNLVNVSIIIFISFLLLNRAEYLNHKDKFWTSIYATTVTTCNSQSGCSPHLKQMKGFQHDDSPWLGAGLTYDLDGQRCVVTWTTMMWSPMSCRMQNAHWRTIFSTFANLTVQLVRFMVVTSSSNLFIEK